VFKKSELNISPLRLGCFLFPPTLSKFLATRLLERELQLFLGTVNVVTVPVEHYFNVLKFLI